MLTDVSARYVRLGVVRVDSNPVSPSESNSFFSGMISYEQSTMLLTMKPQQGHSDRGSAVTASAIQTVGGKTRSVVN